MSQETEWFADRGFSLFRRERKTLAPYWVLTLLALGFVLATYKVYAAPQVHNAEECGLLADMVLVAAALRQGDVSPEKRAGVMDAVYVSALGGADAKRWRELMEGAVRLAERDAAKGLTPHDLAGVVSKSCIQNRGELEPIFGPNA